MPRKGGGGDDDEPALGGKGSKAKAQKAAAQSEKVKKATDAAAAEEAASWQDGANTKAAKKADEARLKLAEAAQKKADIEAQLKREEEEIANGKKLRGTEKVAARAAQKHEDASGAIGRAASAGMEAHGIDAALAVMTIATSDDAGGEAGTDMERAQALLREATTGVKADDAHPERRMKAAFKRFEEREMPDMKAEYPSLRRSQLNDMLWRKFQKSDENPVYAAEKEKRKKEMEGK